MGCCAKRRVYTAHSPLILGEDTGGDPVQVIASVTVMGLRPNERTWVRGSHMQSLIDAGWLRLA